MKNNKDIESRKIAAAELLECIETDRQTKGSIAVIECSQEIPCNACVAACPLGAIEMGDKISNLPVLDEEKCTGCGQCIASCPGLAIFTVNYEYSDERALVSLPYEFIPVPSEGDKVHTVNRDGDVISEAEVVRVREGKKFEKTRVISIAVPKKLTTEVRGIKLLSEERKGEDEGG